MAPSGKETQPTGNNRPKNGPGQKVTDGGGENRGGAGRGKKEAKAKKKADAEKLGWGIGFKELIARAGIDVNDAQQI